MGHDLHPAWKVCIGMALLLFVTFAATGRILQTQQNQIDANAETLDEIQAQQQRGEERSYINRSVAAWDIINDQEIEITAELLDKRVAAYYPPSICAKLPVPVDGCGSKADVITKGE